LLGNFLSPKGDFFDTMKSMKLNNLFKLVIAVGVCELAGVVGSVFTVSSIPTWYATLQKPGFNPPN
jgi:tryptophan-rich sensory protein